MSKENVGLDLQDTVNHLFSLIPFDKIEIKVRDKEQATRVMADLFSNLKGEFHTVSTGHRFDSERRKLVEDEWKIECVGIEGSTFLLK